jgi:hypothetical protein
MLIIPTVLPSGDLILDAFSSDVREFDALAVVLEKCGGARSHRPLPQDAYGRMGRRFTTNASVAANLESRLSIEFTRRGRRTVTTVLGGPTGYRCQAVASSGTTHGCIDISAEDDADAAVKCALIARENAWFGGVASRGHCRR